ncbi:MAG TPA: efflux transporter outer membrane subunit [Rhizomicrobium sp.]|jgi:NodT family efflux transporter outer membrane factor (OMF) lipoprotein|nr:efflux transporter outer membrane subunit [Rhizomicrobium sp.]
MTHTDIGIVSTAHSCAHGPMAFVPIVAALIVAGCTVGPDFKKPAPPEVSGYTAEKLTKTESANVPGGEAQTFTQGGEIAADWWTLFHSRTLNDLIEKAIANSPDLKAAQAALRVAHENTAAQRGAYYPNVSAGFSAARYSQAGTLAPVPNNNAFEYNLFTPQVTVSFVPDVFGLNRRMVESLHAQERGTHYQMMATYTTLTSNVVVAAIQQASISEQIKATEGMIAEETRSVEILRLQLQKGYASGVDLAAQESQLAQAKATLPPLIKQAAQLHDQLAVLCGQFPVQAPAPNLDLENLQLPQNIPVSLPSTIVSQRPDILQAQENLHAANANIGVAIANRLPNIELTGNAGSTALAIGQVFAPGTGFWSLGATLTQPIFEGGKLLHEERGARAAWQQAAAQYRSTVLAAFQNVADSLVALQEDADALQTAATADESAKVTLDLTQRQVKDGHSGYLSLLTAQEASQQAHISLLQAQASRYADTAALFQALGGGWWHRTDLVTTLDPG